MSQEKVDKHKEEKANRRKVMRREKIYGYLRRCAVAVVALALVAWIGYSALNVYQSNRTVETVEIDYSAFDDLSESLEALDLEEE